VSRQALSLESLEVLERYATPLELEALQRVRAAGGSYLAAANGAASEAERLRGRVRECRKRAASRGWAPEHGWNPPELRTEPANTLPEGQRLKGVSDKVDKDGNRIEAWIKSERDSDNEAHTPIPPTFAVKRVAQLTDSQGEVRARWTSYSQADLDRVESIQTAISEHVANYVKPAPVSVAPTDCLDEQLVVYNLGDPHIGMLAWAEEVGESFDLKIAERELCECFRQMVERAPRARRAVIANLGDFWHAQDDNQRTPRGGNKLDVDGRSGKVGRVGLSIVRTLIDSALEKHAAVDFRSLPGNHDPHSAFWLPEVMRATYRHDSRVTVHSAFAPYQFERFGQTLLGWCHGDGAKLDALPGIMATDAPQLWGATRYRYWNVGHVHHWSEKELPGVFVQTHRTLAGRDAWHHHSGYRAQRALKVQTYHCDWGLDSVAVIGVERVRAALALGRAA
jgi:hypothetical protein